jgi:hypothetical protein
MKLSITLILVFLLCSCEKEKEVKETNPNVFKFSFERRYFDEDEFIMGWSGSLTLTDSLDDKCVYYILEEFFMAENGSYGQPNDVEFKVTSIRCFDNIGNFLFEFNPLENNIRKPSVSGYQGKLLYEKHEEISYSKLQRVDSYKIKPTYNSDLLKQRKENNK